MQYVTELMTSRPIVNRVSDQSLIRGTPSSSNGIVSTLGNGYGMIYSSQGNTFTVVMGKVSGTEVKAWWYNPRDGQATYIGEFQNRDTHTFNPPGEPTEGIIEDGFVRNGNDWILVLDDISRGFGAPGQ
jgi:hypothetical protein